MDSTLHISLTTSEDNNIITVHFQSDTKKIQMGFNLEEAQIFSVVLAEAVSAALIAKLQIFVHPDETKH
jgi:hypothetical protein